MHYIISLYHPQHSAMFLTLWGPDNKGYCYSKEYAGIYENPEPGYHNSDDKIPISVEEAEKVFISYPSDGKMIQAIPNCKAIWNLLNVKRNRYRLVKNNKRNR